MAAQWGTGVASVGAERWSLLTGRAADPSERVGMEMVLVSADATIADFLSDRNISTMCGIGARYYGA